MYTTTLDDRKVVMFTSDEISSSFEPQTNYDQTPPVFFVRTSTTGVFLTLGWRQTNKDRDADEYGRCDLCKEKDFTEYRWTQKSTISRDDEMPSELNNSHIATPCAMICGSCVEKIDRVIDQMVEENPVDSVIDYI